MSHKRSLYAQRGMSLQTKLVLSYLGVALGAILLLVIVVSIAVQYYYYQAEVGPVQIQAEKIAQVAAQLYQSSGNSWDQLHITPQPYAPPFVIVDNQGGLHTSPLPVSLDPYTATLQQSLQQALQGHEPTGSFQGVSSDGKTFTVLYASVPIRLNNQTIGAVLLAVPTSYPRGFLTFISQIEAVTFITGLGIALLVIIFSWFTTRRLTKPLVSLTRAAEEMKAGNYGQRVEQLESQDELGRLALTFNAMADKIAADVNELRAQEGMRRDLIANIAHDLVTPLTAIQGYSEAIADDVIVSPEQRHESAQLIGREVQRLRRLVGDMQNMTSLEARRAPLEMAPLNLHDLVEETLLVIAPECEQAQITLHNTIDLATPLALADSDRITQVLLNLLDNARRHTPVGGQIALGAGTQGTWLVVWVSDTGVGISPQDLPYIFERFYRVDRSRSAASGGSGLGLAIIKAIVVSHGGMVWAQSALGHGTTIFFSLPLAQPDAQSITTSLPHDKLLPHSANS